LVDILDIWAEAFGMQTRPKSNPTDRAEERMFKGTGLLSARQEENTPLMFPEEELSERQHIQTVMRKWADGEYSRAFMDPPKIEVRQGTFTPHDFLIFQERTALDMLHAGVSLHTIAKTTYLEPADVARIRRKYYAE